MNNHPSETKTKTNQPPAPEVLKVQSDNSSATPSEETPKVTLRPRRGTYRPSHKATFIGLSVVVLILLINAGVVVFLMNNNQSSQTNATANQSEVVISPEVLDTLGVSKSPIGTTGTELVVNPNSRFNGSLTVAGDVSMEGQLKLNGVLTATTSNLTKLNAGDAAISQLNVSGDGTLTNLSLRKDLTVVGASKLQGPVTISQLLTVESSVNIAGNLSIGGILSIGAFQTNVLTVGGHIITRGSAPSVSSGAAVGSNGTVSISGNDVSGTIATNIGTGGGNGILANITFVNRYTNTPHVMVTAVGRGLGSIYVNRSSTGFSIGVSGSVSPGGYAVDYVVMQ